MPSRSLLHLCQLHPELLILFLQLVILEHCAVCAFIILSYRFASQLSRFPDAQMIVHTLLRTFNVDQQDKNQLKQILPGWRGI